jgi:7-cyano-7-deazaguanine synthase
MNNEKGIVLLSGGIDSTTALAIAINELGRENIATVSILYGQKHTKEIESAKKVAKHYNVSHHIINLSNSFIFLGDNPLLSGSKKEIPHMTYEEQLKRNGEGIVATYVPFRNGLFLSSVASYGMSLYPNNKVILYIAAHKDDATGNAYPDCSTEFIRNMSQAIMVGTNNNVTIKAPFLTNNKSEIVAKGLRLKVPYEITWSCYEGGILPCGKCGTCRDRIKAFELNKTIDPITCKGGK